MIYLFLIIQICFAVIPNSYLFDSANQDREQSDGLQDNTIIDIEYLDPSFNFDDKIFLSTSGGLGYVDNVSLNFYHYIDENLPEGGNPAMVVRDGVIAVSGSESVFHGSEYHAAGTGVSFSTDGGNTWSYMPQPIDSMPELWSCPNLNYNSEKLFSDRSECEEQCFNCNGQSSSCNQIYEYISWAGQDNIVHLAVTTEINNISYDLDILGDYIYSTSWAGGLRRFNYTLPVENREWEIIPLPMDSQSVLDCLGNIGDSYELNPVGNCDSDFDNHKAFSVHVDNENILWVGTAGGVNKGLILDDCIYWEHFTSSQNNFFDDWVIDLEHQILDNGNTRIWAITWEKDSQGSIGPPSYSDDGGETWEYPSQLYQLGVKAYNIFVYNESIVFLSTNLGLYVSDDSEHWEKFDTPVDYESQQQILSNIVYDAEVINKKLWLGTPDGAAISNSFINPEWSIYQFWETQSTFDAFPNPFIIDSDNVINGYGHVRFIYPGQNILSTVDIFNFNMDLVATLVSPISINNQIEFTWNGRLLNGEKVANGVYFCRLNNGGNYKWVKLAIIGS